MANERLNPYAAPQSVQPWASDAHRAILARLGVPSAALLVLAALWEIAWLHAIFVFVAFGSPTQVPLRIDDSALANFVVLSVSAAASAFIAYGALMMRCGKCYRLCVAAAIVACIPVLSPMNWIGIPFGIWSLIVLRRPLVRAAFADYET